MKWKKRDGGFFSEKGKKNIIIKTYLIVSLLNGKNEDILKK